MVADGETNIELVLAGPPGERVALEISWLRNDASEDTQLSEVFTIASPRIDDPAAIIVLSLNNAAVGDTATILTRPVDVADQPLAASAFANTLSLAVAGP